MNSIKYIIAAAVLGLFLCATTKAKEEKVIQFTTLPQVVRTTVFHHYNITAPEKVVRVVELADNIYEVTVVTDSGQQVVFVNAEGNIVERPSGVMETTGGSESAEVTVALDEIQSGGERYEFVQDQGPDAIYIDHQTNKRVLVKGAAGKGPRGRVRTKEGSQTNVQSNERTTEKNETDVRSNEQNKGGVRSGERQHSQQPGSMQEKADQGNGDQGQKSMRKEQRNADQDQKNMTEGEKTQKQNMRGEQREQGNRESTAPDNGQQEKNASQQRNTNGEQQGQKEQRETTRTPGQQQSQEKSQGKGKASPTP
jgi:hypothetical protein